MKMGFPVEDSTQLGRDNNATGADGVKTAVLRKDPAGLEFV